MLSGRWGLEGNIGSCFQELAACVEAGEDWAPSSACCCEGGASSAKPFEVCMVLAACNDRAAAVSSCPLPTAKHCMVT